MNSNFDIVMRDNDFVLYQNEKPLLTPSGKEVAHQNARLLRLAITHEIIEAGADFSALTILKKLIDVASGAMEMFDDRLDEITEKNINGTLHLEEVVTNYPPLMDFVFMNASSLASAWSSFLVTKAENRTKQDFIYATIHELSIEERVVLNCLLSEYGHGISLHLLLLTGHLSVTEYAASLLVEEIKTKANKTPYSPEGISAFQQSISKKATIALDFLTLCKTRNKLSVIEEIIQRGEDDHTEFKSTLRWDIRQDKKNPAIEHASLKTICAFLNSEGGDLFIGVRDDGSIEGVETDQFPNDDRFLLHLWSLIKSSMGEEVVEWVKTTLQKFGDKTVCRVHSDKSKKPIFLRQKGFDEAFYIRTGPGSSSLEISSALKYIDQHF